MYMQSRWLVGLAFGLVFTSASIAQAHSWKSALRDADELYDAAEDLHDRAERFRDSHTLQATCQLEQLTADLYQLLKRNACPADILPVLNATAASLEEASMLVSLSCQLRSDRKAQTELANAQRYFGATVERIQCVLESVTPSRSVYRAPALRFPQPAYPAYPSTVPHSHGSEHEVQNQQPALPFRGLARVRLSGVF